MLSRSADRCRHRRPSCRRAPDSVLTRLTGACTSPAHQAFELVVLLPVRPVAVPVPDGGHCGSHQHRQRDRLDGGQPVRPTAAPPEARRRPAEGSAAPQRRTLCGRYRSLRPSQYGPTATPGCRPPASPIGLFGPISAIPWRCCRIYTSLGLCGSAISRAITTAASTTSWRRSPWATNQERAATRLRSEQPTVAAGRCTCARAPVPLRASSPKCCRPSPRCSARSLPEGAAGLSSLPVHQRDGRPPANPTGHGGAVGGAGRATLPRVGRCRPASSRTAG